MVEKRLFMRAHAECVTASAREGPMTLSTIAVKGIENHVVVVSIQWILVDPP